MDAHEHQAPGGMRPPTPPPSDPAQLSLVTALRSSFAVLRLVMIVLVFLYLLSGIFTIEPGNQGVIVRMGRLLMNNDPASPLAGTPVFGEGWVWAWPDPIDEKIKLDGLNHSVDTAAFLFHRSDEDIANKTDIATVRATGRTLKPGRDGAMLTGDKNLSHGLWSAEFKITRASQFVANVGEKWEQAEPIIQRLLESAVVREVAYRKVEEVTRTKRDVVAEDVKRRLQEELDELQAGITIVKVNANTIVPPQVAAAFDEVTRAEQERKRQEDAARQKATEILNQAAGPQHVVLLDAINRYGAAQVVEAEAARLEALRDEIDALLETAQGLVAVRLREAEAQANGIREELEREWHEFTNRLREYRSYPLQTRVKLWTEMRDAVLSSLQNEVFWVPAGDVIEIIVNRDPQKARAAETGRLRQQIEDTNR